MKPNLLLLHGALGSREQMQPLAPLLEPDFKVHLLNFSGHGEQSGDPHPMRMVPFAREVLDYMHAQQIETCSIFGYSMGGYVGLLVGGLTKKVQRVMTLGTKFHWTPEIAAREVKMLDPDKIEEKVPAFAQFLASRHGEAHWKTVVRKTADMMTSLGQDTPLSPAALKAIQTPVHIILGDQDNMVTAEESQRMASHLANGQFSLLENTPHPFEKVDLERLATHIHRYLIST